MSEKIRVVEYVRMSTDDQVVSIPQQQKDNRDYAKRNNLEIVRTYRDDGKSASKDQEKRTGFQQLLLDATNKPDWRGVLCWNASRFTRQDGIDSAFSKQVLRQQGICLWTTQEGRIDWNTFEGRLHDLVITEQNHKYSRDLAKSSTRGRQDAFNRGKWSFGRVPFGYCRRYSGNDTECVVKRGQAFRKPRGWDCAVIVDEDEAEVVRYIFATFAARDWTLGEMLRHLVSKNLPSPDGKPWQSAGLRYVLENPAYIGVASVGRFRAHKPGKFASIEPTERTDIFAPIVDRTTWDIVQQKLARRETTWTPARREAFERTNGTTKPKPKREKPAPRETPYSPLRGLVYCGRCGSKMSRATIRRGDKVYLYYKCCSYSKDPGKGCRGWSVRDGDLLPRVIEQLVNGVDGELLQTLAVTPEPAAVSDLVIVERQAAELRAKIAQAEERYLTCPSNLMAGLGAKITDWQKQLADLETQARVLAAMKNEKGMGEVFRWWESIKDKLLLLRKREEIPADLDIVEKARRKAIADVDDFITAEKWKEVASLVALAADDPEGIPPERARQALANMRKYIVLAEPDKFRELLHRLGVKIVLRFKACEGKSRCARHRRRRWAKEGKTGRHVYFAVDWERSTISGDFAALRVCASNGIVVTAFDNPDAIRVTFDRVFGQSA